jgi:hypothetical protein
MTGLLVALHLGGVPEAAMFLGPILLIVAFVRIARRREADADEDDWDPDLGDLSQPDTPANSSATSSDRDPSSSGSNASRSR